MKIKLSRIFGVGLTVALLASLLVSAIPVSAATLEFKAETGTPSTTDVIIAQAGTDIVSMAVKGSTIYAATGATGNQTVYKSINTGATWTNLNTTTRWPALPIKLVAVAPDNDQIVVLVTTTENVVYSSNGGAAWDNLGFTAGTIKAIDISPSVAGVYHLAIGGNVAGVAEMWTYTVAMAQTFNARAGSGGFVPGEDVLAVKFSPAYASEKVITCVSANSSSGNSTFQVFRNESGLLKWNNLISFFGADWVNGVTLVGSTGAVTSASIVLPSSYVGSDSGARVAFVGLNAVATADSGVWRVTDNWPKEFSTWNGAFDVQVQSLAYIDGKLLAGTANINNASKVLRSLAPMATDPKFDKTNSFKQPGGDNLVAVAWAGTTAVAATQGNESAFAVSTDDGYTFNDISMIDTDLVNLSDVATSADGSVIYFASYDNTAADASIWLKDGSAAWIRVLSKKLASIPATTSGAFIIRLAPEDAKVIYILSQGSSVMLQSKSGGKESWKDVSCYRLPIVKDFAVQSADVVHAVSTLTRYSKTTSGGVTWGTDVNLDGVAANMISLAPNNDILVGGTDGYVAFSKDAGATFTKTKVFVAGTTVFVAADKDYATNNIIYALAGTAIYRGAADTTTTPASRGPTLDTGLVYTGIAVSDDVVYALASNSSNSSRLYRSWLLKTADSATAAGWSGFSTTNVYNKTPNALKLSLTSTGAKAWAIHDGTTDALHSLTDPLAVSSGAPTQTLPVDGAVIPVNPLSGDAYPVTLGWTRYSSTLIDKVEYQIAADSAFQAKVFDTTQVSMSGDTGAAVIPANSFQPDTTYYWRVRVSAASTAGVTSRWSATRSFKFETAIQFKVIAPAVGAFGIPVKPTLAWNPYSGAVSYEIQVAEDAAFASPSVNATTTSTNFGVATALKYSTSYYWRVRAVTAATTSAWQSGIFTTEAQPVTTPPIIITQPATQPAPSIITVPVQTPAPIPSYLLWIIVVVGIVLVIALIVLIVRTRRVA